MLRLFIVLSLFFSPQVFAQCEQFCVDEGELTLKINIGQGNIDSPLALRQDIKYNVLPSISYYNNDFFIENTKLGYNLFSSNKLTIDVVGKHNRDGVYSYNNDTLAAFSIGGLTDPFVWPDDNTHLSYLAGIESRIYLEKDFFLIGLYDDVSKVHHGEEAEFSWTRVWWNSDIKLSTDLGGIYKSAQTLDYYYGSPLAGSRINYFARLDVAYAITEDVWFVANYHGEKLSDAIRSSQATDKDYLHSFFVGFTWILSW